MLVGVAVGVGVSVEVCVAVGVGVYGSIEQACSRMVSLGTHFDPNPSAREVYDRQYDLYVDLYRAARPLFGRLRG